MLEERARELNPSPAAKAMNTCPLRIKQSTTSFDLRKVKIVKRKKRGPRSLTELKRDLRQTKKDLARQTQVFKNVINKK